VPPISSEMLHATTVAIDGQAVVIEGRSGAGKSDLALRLIDRGAVLVADDQTLLVRQGDRVIARCPDTIAGQLEVRGIGIVTLPHATDVPVALIVRLGDEDQRMPERRTRRVAGVVVPEVVLSPFHASVTAKIATALRHEAAKA
jgi:serine kinase of HPr protein (carbohydrate metabolism regulator)